MSTCGFVLIAVVALLIFVAMMALVYQTPRPIPPPQVSCTHHCAATGQRLTYQNRGDPLAPAPRSTPRSGP